MLISTVATYHVGERTWQSPTIWYASTIVHDGFHSLLFYQSRSEWLRWVPFLRLTSWTGKNAERQCLRIQIEALQDLGADLDTIEYVTQLTENPIYQRRLFRNW